MQTQENFKDQDSKIIEIILESIKRCENTPTFICIDGRSGVGKSTISKKLSNEIPTTIISSDDFYCNLDSKKLLSLSVQERYETCVDYEGFIEKVLAPLKMQGQANWIDFRGQNHNAKLSELVIVEGIYCGRPELEEYFNLKFLIQLNDDQRRLALKSREPSEQLRNWHNIFDCVEDYYFNEVISPNDFTQVFERHIENHR